MPTSNEEFIKKAFEAGLTEDQVRSAVAERNQRKASISDSPSSSGVQDTLQSVANMLGVGSTARNLKTAITAPLLGKQADEVRASTDQTIANSRKLIDQAKTEKDPLKKKLLLDASRAIDQDVSSISGNLESQISDVMKQGGVTEQDLGGSNLGFATKRGVGTGAEVASLLIPATQAAQRVQFAAKTTGPVARLAEEGVKGAIQGGLQGGAEAAVSAENPLDAVRDVLTGGAVGGVTSTALQGVAEGRNLIAGGSNKLTSVAKNMYKSTLKENIRDQKFYKQAGGLDSVVDDAVRLNIPSTKEGVRSELARYGDEFSNKVDEELLNAQKQGKTIDLSKMYETAKKTTLDQLSGPEDKRLRDQAMSYFDEADKFYLTPESKKTNLSQVNTLRKKLDSRVGEILQQDIGNGEAKAFKNFATTLRNEFKKELPNLKDDFRRYHLLSGLAEAMQKEPISGLTEAVGFLGGAAMGGPEALAAAGAVKAIRSPGLKRKISSKFIQDMTQRGKQSITKMTPDILQSVASILASRGVVSQ